MWTFKLVFIFSIASPVLCLFMYNFTCICMRKSDSAYIIYTRVVEGME